MHPTQHRGTVVSADGVVASAHPLVSLIGATVLRDGGTAVDAALAMAAMSFVVLPGQCGPGGDAFAVVYDASTRQYRSIQGSGAGPTGGDADFFARRGLGAVPLAGPLAVAVPGELACIAALHADGATRPIEELWRPAIEAARRGVAITAKTVGDIREQRAALAADDEAARVFLPGGAPPSVGSRFAQPDLAATLDRLARDPADFYHGGLAQRCVAALRAADAPYDGVEWSATRAVVEPTVAIRYRDLTVHTASPPSPGYMLLAQAGVLDGVLGDKGWLATDAVDWMAQAATGAFADRLALVGSDSPAWRDLLDPAVLLRRRVEIATAVPGESVRVQIGPGDTTSCVAVDRHGNAVSFIHSLGLTFGSGVLVPGTGVLLNNRLGRGSYLRPGHPNEVAPGRKPMHTLLAWIAAGPDGAPAVVANTPGGDGQVQWNMQLLSHVADHQLNPQQAVEAPRFTVFPGSDAHAIGAPPQLICESRFDAQTLAGLADRGHTVRTVAPYGAGGGAQMIVCAGGVLSGGSDPRQDGCALSA